MKYILYSYFLLISLSSLSQINNVSDSTLKNKDSLQFGNPSAGLHIPATGLQPASPGATTLGTPEHKTIDNIFARLFLSKEDSFNSQISQLTKATLAILCFAFSLFIYNRSYLLRNKISDKKPATNSFVQKIITYLFITFILGFFWFIIYDINKKWIIGGFFPFFTSMSMFPFGVATINFIEFLSLNNIKGESVKESKVSAWVQLGITIIGLASSIITIYLFLKGF